MVKLDNFAIFITSHKRAESLISYNTLNTCGYTNKIYVVVDNEDPQVDLYKEKYDNVVVFNKQEYMNKVDTICYPKISSAVVFARAFIEDYVKTTDLKSFLVMDDDITRFVHRYVDEEGKLRSKLVKDLDGVLNVYIEFLLENNINTLSFGTGASYIGGADCLKKDMKRRCFNTFIRNTSRELVWLSNMNEDYISSVDSGMRGELFFELASVGVETKEVGKGTQQGGMIEIYKQMNDYKRSMFSVVSNPSCFVVQQKNDKYVIKCNWNKAVPKIISDRKEFNYGKR